jgi:hypothetical protein
MSALTVDKSYDDGTHQLLHATGPDAHLFPVGYALYTEDGLIWDVVATDIDGLTVSKKLDDISWKAKLFNHWTILSGNPPPPIGFFGSPDPGNEWQNQADQNAGQSPDTTLAQDAAQDATKAGEAIASAGSELIIAAVAVVVLVAYLRRS